MIRLFLVLVPLFLLCSCLESKNRNKLDLLSEGAAKYELWRTSYLIDYENEVSLNSYRLSVEPIKMSGLQYFQYVWNKEPTKDDKLPDKLIIYISNDGSNIWTDPEEVKPREERVRKRE